MRTITFYRAKTSGEIFIDTQLHAFNSIMGWTIPDMIEKGLVVEIKKPTVNDILQANGRDNITPAITRYRQINKCSGKDAADAVRALVKEMYADTVVNESTEVEV